MFAYFNCIDALLHMIWLILTWTVLGFCCSTLIASSEPLLLWLVVFRWNSGVKFLGVFGTEAEVRGRSGIPSEPWPSNLWISNNKLFMSVRSVSWGCIESSGIWIFLGRWWWGVSGVISPSSRELGIMGAPPENGGVGGAAGPPLHRLEEPICRIVGLVQRHQHMKAESGFFTPCLNI